MEAHKPRAQQALTLCPPRERHFGVGLSEKNQHISNLFFRPDRKLSFQIDTALKIIAARHEVLITAHLLLIRQHRLQSAHESARLLTRTQEMDSEGFRTNAHAAAEPLQPHPPLGELTYSSP